MHASPVCRITYLITSSEGKPVWQPVEAMLIIALCTKGLICRGRARKAAPLCSQDLESSREHTPPSSRGRGNCVENALASHLQFVVLILCSPQDVGPPERLG
jgi:hypothetical protein